MLLGEFIKEYRMSHNNMSQDTFAKLSGISKGYISMLENNRNPRTKLPISPTIDMYKKVASVVGISLNELFAIVDSPVDISSSSYLDEQSDDTREILDMLSDMTPEELALVKSRIQKIKESR